MAVKTNFSENDFIAILSHYDLGTYECSDPIAGGTVQTNYFIRTTEGKFIFRCYENRSKESVLFECNLMKYLKDKNYPCPAPYPNRSGEYVGVHLDKPFVLFEFIEGEHLENPNEAQKKQLIHKVAELQNLTKNYRPVNKQYRWNYDVGLCADLARKAAQTVNTAEATANATANASRKLEWFHQELANLSLPKTLPKGICHCDFHFSNILFKDGAFAALIDFDDANYTFLTYDLATLVDPFIKSFDWDSWPRFERGANVLDFREARNVAAEYGKVRPLQLVEKRHLFDVFKLSILFDCVWYFSRGNADDFYEKRKIDSLNRLGREGFMEGVF